MFDAIPPPGGPPPSPRPLRVRVMWGLQSLVLHRTALRKSDVLECIRETPCELAYFAAVWCSPLRHGAPSSEIRSQTLYPTELWARSREGLVLAEVSSVNTVAPRAGGWRLTEFLPTRRRLSRRSHSGGATRAPTPAGFRIARTDFSEPRQPVEPGFSGAGAPLKRLTRLRPGHDAPGVRLRISRCGEGARRASADAAERSAPPLRRVEVRDLRNARLRRVFRPDVLNSPGVCRSPVLRPRCCQGTEPAGPRAVAPYVPRAAADTVLHGVVREHLETFLAAAAARADGVGLPRFIER